MSKSIFETIDFTPKGIARNETLFTTANGHLGFRGDFEEKKGSVHKGTYINGFFDSEPIVYGESAYGYAQNHQTILNLPDPKAITCYINSFPFSVEEGTVRSFVQSLDLKKGVMNRRVAWTAPDGTRVIIETKRIVPFAHPSCAVIEYSIQAEDNKVSIVLESSIDTSIKNISAEEDPRVGSKFSSNPLLIDMVDSKNDVLSLYAVTRNSGLALAGKVSHEIKYESLPKKEIDIDFKMRVVENCPTTTWNFTLDSTEKIVLHKYICYQTAKLSSFSNGDAKQALLEKAHTSVLDFKLLGIKKIEQEQAAFLTNFWNIASIQVEGDSELEQALDFNVYHLLQSAGRDGTTSIAAKGLTAEGYEGHYFWDTEAYVCPVFTYVDPPLAKKLLEYRYSILPKARTRAKVMNLKGALFPWRTIDGEETSAYYPAGTAQYHINGDIMYALQKFMHAQGEDSFDSAQALEMGIETARMWMSLGYFIPSMNNKFCIHEVTGPDEYTACVNNNIYTNLIARENLKFSISLVEKFGTQVSGVLPVEKEELAEWKQAVQNMYIPYNETLGIYPQDDSFLNKPAWDFENTPKENYPLLLHYHPLVIYRHQVLKQPDLVLAQMMLSQDFKIEEKRRNFLFYEALTTGDSSLSHCIQSIMACETGDVEKGLRYFEKTARMDIADMHGNTCDGIHTAAMAGSWMSIVYGFAGFRDYKGTWAFDPKLPAKWKKLQFSLVLGSSILDVCIEKDRCTYSLRSGAPISLQHRNKIIYLESGEPISCSLKPELQAVLFDLDGIVTDTAELHYKAWKTIFTKHGLHFSQEINEQLKGVSRSESLEIVLRHNKKNIADVEKQYILTEKNNLYVELLETLSEKDILPGIKNLLLELKMRGIKTALASSSKNAPKICEKLGITSLFDGIADVGLVKMSKPEPDIFYEAARIIDVWPTDCAGIEDAQAGIDAIKAAGIKAIGVGAFLKGADIHIATTEELNLHMLESLFL